MGWACVALLMAVGAYRINCYEEGSCGAGLRELGELVRDGGMDIRSRRPSCIALRRSVTIYLPTTQAFASLTFSILESINYINLDPTLYPHNPAPQSSPFQVQRNVLAQPLLPNIHAFPPPHLLHLLHRIHLNLRVRHQRHSTQAPDRFPRVLPLTLPYANNSSSGGW